MDNRKESELNLGDIPQHGFQSDDINCIILCIKYMQLTGRTS